MKLADQLAKSKDRLNIIGSCLQRLDLVKAKYQRHIAAGQFHQIRQKSRRDTLRMIVRIVGRHTQTLHGRRSQRISAKPRSNIQPMSLRHKVNKNFHKGGGDPFLQAKIRQQLATIVHPLVAKMFPPKSDVSVAIVELHQSRQHQPLKLIRPTNLTQKIIDNPAPHMTRQRRSTGVQSDISKRLSTFFQSRVNQIIRQPLPKTSNQMSLSAARFSIDDDARTAIVRSRGINRMTAGFIDALMNSWHVRAIIGRLPWIANNGSTKWIERSVQQFVGRVWSRLVQHQFLQSEIVL